MLLANLVVYGAGLTRLAQGPGGTMDYFLSLAEVNEAVEAGEYYRSASHIHSRQKKATEIVSIMLTCFLVTVRVEQAC